MGNQRSVRAGLVSVALLMAATGFAQGPGPQGQGAGPPREKFERRQRMIRVIQISEDLHFTDAESLKLNEQLTHFDVRRLPLQRELTQQVQLLRRAAQGDASTFAQVDTALTRAQQLKAQIQGVDVELFTALSKGMTPQKKAQLALTLARLPGEIREAAREVNQQETREERRRARQSGQGAP